MISCKYLCSLTIVITVLCYHRKIRRLILGRYCRYLYRSFENWIDGMGNCIWREIRFVRIFFCSLILFVHTPLLVACSRPIHKLKLLTEYCLRRNTQKNQIGRAVFTISLAACLYFLKIVENKSKIKILLLKFRTL